MLVDHLVAGSKESRIVDGVRDPNVLVTGHPYVDIWQAVRPAVVGIERVAGGAARARRGRTASARRWAGASRPTAGGGCSPRVRSYKDLETPLIGAVERLIDFVTTGEE